jgi:hypothetical protein
VDLSRVVAGQPTVTHHRVSMHPQQTAGLADAAAFSNVLQHGKDLLLGQVRAE